MCKSLDYFDLPIIQILHNYRMKVNCDSRIIKVEVARGYKLKPKVQADNPY